ncbi:ABC transporter ATP-binding protein [[Mycoplasma] testudinis]|uniref:ABC transporter ATP-binding protein n=1 Tax=[Mycoplasma] testudinis TaxID=33924 RepID=UPI000481877D|nr:ABC transporter ATP-binding protein [[Mycoplasma] testudinis]
MNQIEPILNVKHLTKKFLHKKVPTIQDLNFCVYPKQFHAFIGANGAGKTTTIKCIIGAYAKKGGSILINGIDSNLPAAKKSIGYIPENSRFPSHFKVFDYLLMMARISGLEKKYAQTKITEFLHKFNMMNLRDGRPNNFSSGQKKKLVLIQALLTDPKLLIMDEPTANLDPKARLEFFEIIKELQNQGSSIFLSSHVLSEIDNYADSLTVLDNGSIVLTGSIAEIRKKYTHHLGQYVISILPESYQVCEQFFKEMKITYKYNFDSNKFTVWFDNTTSPNEILEKLVTAKVKLTGFSEYHFSIEEIYEQFVKIGSVDTKKIFES